MLERMGFGTVLYEIVYDIDGPFIYDFCVNEFDISPMGVYVQNKPLGANPITEEMIGASVFLSYNAAEKRLNYLRGEENG